MFCDLTLAKNVFANVTVLSKDSRHLRRYSVLSAAALNLDIPLFDNFISFSYNRNINFIVIFHNNISFLATKAATKIKNCFKDKYYD